MDEKITINNPENVDPECFFEILKRSGQLDDLVDDLEKEKK